MFKRITVIVFICTAVALVLPMCTANAAQNEWVRAGGGAVYYADFPSGYNTGSALYKKYNGKKINPYENSTSKREVAKYQVSWIYWHWTFNNIALPNDNYNVFIEDHYGWDPQINKTHQFFSEFESAENYSEYDPYGNHDPVRGRYYYCWRGIPSEGSWWWLRIPVYKQEYTDYLKETTQPASPSSDNQAAMTKYKIPKGTALKNCRGGKSKATVKWKKKSKNCSGYQIRYSTRKDFKNCKVKTVKGRTKTSCTLKKLKGGKKYYIQVRVYCIKGNKTYYSTWSKCKTLITKKAAKSSTSRSSKNKKKTVTAESNVTTTYNEVIKSGNTVYCVGPWDGIYKVTLNKGKVKNVKTLAKPHNTGWGGTVVEKMKKHGEYIYYIQGSDGFYFELRRVNVSSGKNQLIATMAYSYAIKNNKIYVEIIKGDSGEYSIYRSMNLNGKNKKKTSVRPKMKTKKSNAKGYSVKFEEHYATDYKGYEGADGISTYLQTPNGALYLDTVWDEFHNRYD